MWVPIVDRGGWAQLGQQEMYAFYGTEETHELFGKDVRKILGELACQPHENIPDGTELQAYVTKQRRGWDAAIQFEFPKASTPRCNGLFEYMCCLKRDTCASWVVELKSFCWEIPHTY